MQQRIVYAVFVNLCRFVLVLRCCMLFDDALRWGLLGYVDFCWFMLGCGSLHCVWSRSRLYADWITSSTTWRGCGGHPTGWNDRFAKQLLPFTIRKRRTEHVDCVTRNRESRCFRIQFDASQSSNRG